MDLLDGLMTTRAIRRYTDEPVTEDEILTCLRAAVQAPSGGNIQPYQFVVVTEQAIKRDLGEVYRRGYWRYVPARDRARPAPRSAEDADRITRMERSAHELADAMGGAPALVLVLMPRISMTLTDEAGAIDVGAVEASVYPAVQNFMLAARALGIGTVLTTAIRVHQQEARALLGIPDRYEIAALIPMGRPRGRFGVAPRRPAESLTHWNRWGARRPGPDAGSAPGG